VGDVSYVVFGEKFLREKGDVIWYVIVMQQPVLLPPKFKAKSGHIFKQSPENVTLFCLTDCLACQDERKSL
jgi:hypothetical protein